MSVGATIEADRPREVEHLVDDAIEPLDLAVDVGGRFADVAGASRRRASADAARP